MTKFNSFVFLILFICSPLFSDEKLNKANDYIFHCNFSFGVSFGINGKIMGSHGLGLNITDGYNDTYYFNYDPNNSGKSIIGVNIMLSFPFYYNTFFSAGMYGQTLLEDFFGDDSKLYYGGGLYAEGIYRHFSFRAGLGVFGINMSKTIGKLAPAWAGDPGYYTGSRFIKPGESLVASSYKYLGFSPNFAIKYYPFKYRAGILRAINIQLGYYYFPAIEISEYELNLAGLKIDYNNPLPLFKVESTHNICLMFGIGL